MEIPFVGGAYKGRSPNLNSQECQNLFPVIDPLGKKVKALFGTPGLSLFTSLLVNVTTPAAGVISFAGVLTALWGYGQREVGVLSFGGSVAGVKA